MAIVDYQLSTPFRGASIVKWPSLANEDTGRPYSHASFNDRSVDVLGTFGSGGTVLIEGSNEVIATSFATLNDQQGNPVSVTLRKIVAIMENVVHIRPRVSAVDANTLIDVYLLLVGGE